MRQRNLRIALLGAESSGKTTLAQALVRTAHADGRCARAVPEVLRAWCDARGRVPLPGEQADVARAQAHALAQVAHEPGWLISDTTPLITAVYSELLFGDLSLYPMALAEQARFDVTLLMALDLPWVADGIQRDGPHVRQPVDRLIRSALEGAGIPYRLVEGSGPNRLRCALDHIHAAQARADATR